MKFEKYDFSMVEPEILSFWESEQLRKLANKQNADGKPFYFLDGPPYTTGNVHVGHAWNKSMKDVVCRARRMQGRDVWDRAGYDTHGLPNEHSAMKELNLRFKDEIEKFGVDKFSQYCYDMVQERIAQMNEQFTRLGVWMDFENAYQTLSDEWIEAQWFMIKKAFENGRLYKGMRSMAWDPEHETALAKHELEYKSVEDKSIFVKFKALDAPNEYFVIWTTTPWTIPFNLMIMVNPDKEYTRVRVGDETWVVAKDLVTDVLAAANMQGDVVNHVKGSDLVGKEYEHFFAGELDYAALKDNHPNVHTIVQSQQYVTTDGGSGLVHAAPGCGPEDYEVGVEMNVPAWNLLDEQGYFPKDAGMFAGRRARYEDDFFIDAIKQAGMLVAIKPYVHDYPHAQRSKSPVVFRTTEQWFFRVQDVKEQMIGQNNEVHWMPEAGFNAFNSWLENLRDNSITKQRFWGTPFPMWINPEDSDDVIVVGSLDELKELADQKVTNVHKPWIDDITITKDSVTYHRSPDVVDVWVDAGVAAWACLHYPHRSDLFDKYFPADFIIEGNDQIRGWFNLLMVSSTVVFDKAPFKNVYMHGMINDAHGRKMSKSEGNYILPEEVIDKYGADTFRLYTIGGTRAGLDLNYNFEDCQNTQRNLLVFWNVHKYLLDLASQVPFTAIPKDLSLEDKYILARTQQATKRSLELLDNYAIDRLPEVAQELLFDISRTYIQSIRPIVASGSNEEKQRVLAVLHEAFSVGMRLLAPLCPFITEAMFQNMKKPFGYDEKSVHLQHYPTVHEAFVNDALVDDMNHAQTLLSVILSARDSAQIGVRWPLGSVEYEAPWELSDALIALVCQQTNVKHITRVSSLDIDMRAKPNFRNLGKSFGEKTADLAKHISENAKAVATDIFSSGKHVALDVELTTDHVDIARSAKEGLSFAQDGSVMVLLDTAQTDELLKEGFARELTRQIQKARKDGDFDKSDSISLVFDKSLKDLEPYFADLTAVVNAKEYVFGDWNSLPHTNEFTSKKRTLAFGFKLANE